MDTYLTKTDFIHYLRCPKSLWLLKNRPEEYPHREFSEFLQKITREGYEVEEYAQRLFPSGVPLPSGADAAERTRQAVGEGVPVLFQATFLTDDGMFVRADILEQNDDGTHNLYEVKSSTKVKKDNKHNHIQDVCFQMVALEKSGLTVRDAFIIHADPEYVFDGTVNPHALLKKTCITDEVRQKEDVVCAAARNALTFIRTDSIDEAGCACYFKTRSNHCDTFTYFNGEKEECSVWNLARVSEKKLCTLLDRGVTHLSDVPEDIELNTHQQFQVRSAQLKEPVVLREKVAAMLEKLVFPLHFLDYETAMHAVPRVVGMRPWQQIPFQFSLHTMQKDGSLEHHEYVSDTLNGTEAVLGALCGGIGPEGSVVSWHASFEKTRNREMGELYPAYRDALLSINERMFDLEDIFKDAYVDRVFRGSTSIKKVLPVLCSGLSYADLGVQDGTQAMERWLTMIDRDTNPETRVEIDKDLREYCRTDTLAMVELYRRLRDVAD